MSATLTHDPPAASRRPTAVGARAWPRLARAAGQLLAAVLVVMGACVGVFLAMNWLPGDPARRRLGLGATPAQLAAERHRLGLDTPVPVRLGRWLSGLAHGNLGRSWTSDRPVTAILGDAMHNSAWLMGTTVVITVPLLVVVAVACGLHLGGIIDRVMIGIGAIGSAVPSFVFGVVALLVFSARLGWLPALSSPDPQRPMIAQLNLLVLPVTVLALGLVAYLVQIVRAQVVTVAQSAFVEAARLRGVSRTTLARRHLLPSIVPVAGQLAAITIITLTTETVVVEVVFSYPGIGAQLQAAVADQDLPVVQGITLVLAALVVVANGLSTILTTLLTPALRTRP